MPPATPSAQWVPTEVITNAVQHTGTPTIKLETAVLADGVRVAVYDDGPAGLLLPPSEAAQDSEDGRGLLLVQTLAHAWGVGPAYSPGRTGKHVWFELQSPSAPLER
ncbi:ATP-binding protein [Streptomyces flaveus]|uniref:Histidine kinase/HSP90-like ATPase domain-containing protein n=1 Tax=Streptomyces flaveus TaxID=66370 RepID=A0A917QWM9_9ACTN|nr:ATP-binding protein [Streptomyces flaveus]GGK73837.1 hypothetical protein GCM10010094_38510 [Streptomyces flaveus]